MEPAHASAAALGQPTRMLGMTAKRDLSCQIQQVALKFCLSHPAVSTVIPGIRNVAQAMANVEVSRLPLLPSELQEKLKGCYWRRSIWYEGK